MIISKEGQKTVLGTSFERLLPFVQYDSIMMKAYGDVSGSFITVPSIFYQLIIYQSLRFYSNPAKTGCQDSCCCVIIVCCGKCYYRKKDKLLFLCDQIAKAAEICAIEHLSLALRPATFMDLPLHPTKSYNSALASCSQFFRSIIDIQGPADSYLRLENKQMECFNFCETISYSFLMQLSPFSIALP